MTAKLRTPVALVSGFLGAGKTTLINRLLRAGHLADAALVVNEFGEAGIDHLLVETVQDDVIELAGGCLCCSIRGSLVDTLTRVMTRKQRPPSRIVVETTGVADPLPVMQVILGHPNLNHHLALTGLLVVVDAVHGEQILKREPAARAQVALADHIAISKTDLKADWEPLGEFLSMLNSHAERIKARETDAVAAALASSASVENTERTAFSRQTAHDVGDLVSVSLMSDTPITRQVLRLFFDDLQSRSRGEVLRMKGMFFDASAPERPAIVHAVQNTLYPFEVRDDWPDERRETRLVVIGRDLDARAISDRFRALTGKVVSDTPDLAALRENPLAVPGVRF